MDQAKQENLARQKAEQARQDAVERQKAEKARQEATRSSSSNSQNDSQTSAALGNADKALRMKNYSTAKRIARDVLASSPNNAQALRILRQAEEGEAKAFDNMVIE